MIEKISSVNQSYKSKTKAVAPAKAQAQATTNSSYLAGSNMVSAYQAMNGIKVAKTVSFAGELTDLEKSFIKDKEVRIPNLLDLDTNIDMPLKNMPADSKNLNTAGLNIVKTQEDGRDVYRVSNDLGNEILYCSVDRTKTDLPVVTYKQGKFMPEATVKDPSLHGATVKMLAGSVLKGDGFEIRMPGEFEAVPGGARKKVSFKGLVAFSTLNKEEKSREAVNAFINSEHPSKVVKGDFADEMQQDDVTVLFPVGGDGTRFHNISRDIENKPSTKMPTDPSYRMLGAPLSLAASAGSIKGDGTDDIVYLSQKHELEKSDNVYHVGKYNSDGGAIAEGLRRDIIPMDKPLVIINGDVTSNADISRAYHALKTLPDAALVIPYYPANPDRAKAFGLLGVEKDENNNLQIKEFLEKPKHTNKPPLPDEYESSAEYNAAMEKFLKVQTAINPDDENSFLANPGFYFLNPASLKVLMAKGILEPNNVGLGASVMPKIVELANKGDLLDEKGNKLKVYTVPLEAKGGRPAFWDDLGTAEAYLSYVKDAAKETREHGYTPANKYYGQAESVLRDFVKNTDPETGIVFMSPDAKSSLKSFVEKHNVEVVEGNILVSDYRTK